MPYIIKKVSEDKKSGYKVCKRDEPNVCFSKKPLSKEKAKKQRIAIFMSEMGLSRKGGMEMPKTIQGIKEALIEMGHGDAVFRMDDMKPKPKKADWVDLFNRLKDKRVEDQATGDTEVRNAEEAFRALGITGKRSPSPQARAPSTRSKTTERVKLAASLSLSKK